ncbi:putative mucin/carbohydrate-binding domain-containing protein [Candidatus Fukatsuia symbiotica]|uniref:Peptidase metallopeptidase domain-containing protein n=1 Tax=Candidatus Fukatsuia symbiotica TaxID=1878942 RepID=A0A2U8I5V4_9GAMM|nr:putative mucin/carbohydrate-binding domain-containing protein [Candidatus Fukatsuia symbiotica]AWK14546.1 hypothetical protein CCS41_08790 [Candidatus Fukatsuia symbiotica]MEA9444845.1 putative mucin/carbohydrate-binding domain-containing protein [Candidatus Fukatsuia symbiotica]
MSHVHSVSKEIQDGRKWKSGSSPERGDPSDRQGELTLTFKYLTPNYQGRAHYDGDQYYTNLTTFTDQQREMTQSVLNEIADLTGLEFRMVESAQPSNLTFGNFLSPGNPIKGYAFYPNPPNPSPVWINSENLSNFKKTITHEIGHALGLKHTNSLANPNSVMSYDFSVDELQLADIVALRALYGHDTDPRAAERIQKRLQARDQQNQQRQEEEQKRLEVQRTEEIKREQRAQEVRKARELEWREHHRKLREQQDLAMEIRRQASHKREELVKKKAQTDEEERAQRRARAIAEVEAQNRKQALENARIEREHNERWAEELKRREREKQEYEEKLASIKQQQEQRRQQHEEQSARREATLQRERQSEGLRREEIAQQEAQAYNERVQRRSQERAEREEKDRRLEHRKQVEEQARVEREDNERWAEELKRREWEKQEYEKELARIKEQNEQIRQQHEERSARREETWQRARLGDEVREVQSEKRRIRVVNRQDEVQEVQPEKRRIRVMNQARVKPENYQKKFTLLGIEDAEFSSISIDETRGVIRVDVIAATAHDYFSNQTYASIQVKDKEGRIVFYKEIKGTDAELSRVDTHFREGYQLEIYHAEAETRLASSSDMKGISVSTSKTNNFTMTATGLERILSSHQFTFLDRSNWKFASLSVDATKEIMNIDVSKPLLDDYFRDHLYASIQIKNTQGEVIFNKEIKGIDREVSRAEIPFAQGYQLEIYHAEAENRLKIFSDNNVIGVNSRTSTFIMTSTGLEKQTFSLQPEQHNTTAKMAQVMSTFPSSRSHAVSVQPGNTAYEKYNQRIIARASRLS